MTAIEVHDLGIKFPVKKRKASRLINYVPQLWHRRNGQQPDEPQDFWALSHVSFNVDKGERIGIIGLNGSGKSTLLRAVAGIYGADEGYVKLQTPLSSILGLSLGFQKDLNGIDNIKLSAAVMGMKHKDIVKALPDIVAFADLQPPEYINKPIHTYSSGMQARLAFALAIHCHAETILVDEILGAGDAAFQSKCAEAVRSLLTSRTLLLVSHSASQVQSFCTRCLWLHRGKLLMDGPTDQVVAAYQDYVATLTQKQEVPCA